MSQKDTDCMFLHPACKAGCTKYLCRSHYPKSQPVVQEGTLPLCKGMDHADCERYKDGLEFQEERRKAKKGCQFLSNSICGNPDVWHCKGGNYPALLKGKYMNGEANFDISPCQDTDGKECPRHQEGLRLQQFVRDNKRGD